MLLPHRLFTFALFLFSIITIGSALPAAPITDPSWITEPGVYQLQNDLTDIGTTAIEIRCSDVILDGSGHTIRGDTYSYNQGRAIVVKSPTGAQIQNVTITNIRIEDYLTGIVFENVHHSTIENLFITRWGSTYYNTGYGVSLSGSSNNTITSSLFTGPRVGRLFYGIYGSDCRDTLISDNTLFTPAVVSYYPNFAIYLTADDSWYESTGLEPEALHRNNMVLNNSISGFEGGIILREHGSTAQTNTIQFCLGYYGTSGSFYPGTAAISTLFGNLIAGNRITTGDGDAIEAQGDNAGVVETVIEGNHLSGYTGTGIALGTDGGAWIHGAFVVRGNEIVDNSGVGITVTGGTVSPNLFATITGNTIRNNAAGGIGLVVLACTVSRNTIRDNGIAGIILTNSNGNVIYDNAFNNTKNAKFAGTVTGNTWNLTKTSGPSIVGGSSIGGNYWATPTGSGWSQTHEDGDGDGIIDQPYQVYMGNIDHLPLANTTRRPAVIAIPGGEGVPTDTDNDGLYDDVNGNGRIDFGDVVLYFNQMSWIIANEPLSAFDFNANDRIDFSDVVWLFNSF